MIVTMLKLLYCVSILRNSSHKNIAFRISNWLKAFDKRSLRNDITCSWVFATWLSHFEL